MRALLFRRNSQMGSKDTAGVSGVRDFRSFSGALSRSTGSPGRFNAAPHPLQGKSRLFQRQRVGTVHLAFSKLTREIIVILCLEVKIYMKFSSVDQIPRQWAKTKLPLIPRAGPEGERTAMAETNFLEESGCWGNQTSELSKLFRQQERLSWASLVAQTVKNPPAMRETWVQSLGWEDPLEEAMATHSSILAWRIPMDRGAWEATVHGVAESDTTE